MASPFKCFCIDCENLEGIQNKRKFVISEFVLSGVNCNDIQRYSIQSLWKVICPLRGSDDSQCYTGMMS